MNQLKKPFPRVLLVLCGVVCGIIITYILCLTTGLPFFGKIREDDAPRAKSNNAELTALAFSVLENIKNGDYEALSSVAHPKFGVIFSPCATVTLNTNRYFQSKQIALFGADTNAYVWGVRSGSGEPIEMTPRDYFASFVFDKDYTAASIIGIDRIVKSGNALENIKDIFPDVRFVDFHITGGDRDSAEDLSWSSLRLGFEDFEGRLWLTVILHSEWTE